MLLLKRLSFNTKPKPSSPARPRHPVRAGVNLVEDVVPTDLWDLVNLRMEATSLLYRLRGLGVTEALPGQYPIRSFTISSRFVQRLQLRPLWWKPTIPSRCPRIPKLLAGLLFSTSGSSHKCPSPRGIFPLDSPVRFILPSTLTMSLPLALSQFWMIMSPRNSRRSTGLRFTHVV